MLSKLRQWLARKIAPAVIAVAESTPIRSTGNLVAALEKARLESAKRYVFPIQPPELPAGVVPSTVRRAPVMATDSGGDGYGSAYSFASRLQGSSIAWNGFPGYPYLAMLSTRAEFRMFAQALGTALTREWIVLNSTETASDETKDKIAELNEEIRKLGLRDAIRQSAEQDSYYGRAQIFLDLVGQSPETPLVLSDKTIKKGTKFRIKTVEAMWTTPAAYNAIDPSDQAFYKPTSWFMLGRQVHWTRLQTIITRPVLDMLKPAFNFGGMSMSQLAEPYVDNWLRTRQSVSDLIANFSTTALATDTAQMLTGAEGASQDADNVFARAELFTLTRSNKGLMLLDKEREELVQVNTPLSGLAELQAQSQEQQCSVSHIPAVVLLGISPTGFGNLAEGEIRAFYDWIAAEQEAHWRKPIEQIINILQLCMYGMIDPDITMAFQPLYQMTPKELAEIRTADANTDAAYLDRQVLAPEEVREKLARNPESGYQGLDLSKVPEDPQEEENEDVP